MFGLTNQDIQYIIDEISNYPQIEEAIIFGSRALNTYQVGSDIDIALKGEEIQTIVPRISGILNEESPLPYFFDILDYNMIDNSDLRDHINRVGQIIYKKTLQKKD